MVSTSGRAAVSFGASEFRYPSVTTFATIIYLIAAPLGDLFESTWPVGVSKVGVTSNCACATAFSIRGEPTGT